MPLGLGLASSHAPSMFAAPEDWPRIYETLTRGVPQPPEAADETPEVIATYVQRIRKNLRTLREQLDAYQPDAIIIVGDDQREVFGPAFSPSIAIYLGDSVDGSRSIGLAGQSYDDNHVTLPCHAALARHLLRELVERQFDLAYVEELQPLSRPAAGLGHAFMHLGGGLGLHDLGVPVIPLWVNAYFPPCPTAARCYALGQALRAIADARHERIAILGSGGLSHDPRGSRRPDRQAARPMAARPPGPGRGRAANPPVQLRVGHSTRRHWRGPQLDYRRRRLRRRPRHRRRLPARPSRHHRPRLGLLENRIILGLPLEEGRGEDA